MTSCLSPVLLDLKVSNTSEISYQSDNPSENDCQKCHYGVRFLNVEFSNYEEEEPSNNPEIL